MQSQSGEMSEWLKEPASKTGVRQRTGGSNPSLTAQCKANQGAARKCGTFAFGAAMRARFARDTLSFINVICENVFFYYICTLHKRMSSKSLISVLMILASLVGSGRVSAAPAAQGAGRYTINYKVGRTGVSSSDVFDASMLSEIDSLVARVRKGDAGQIRIKSYSSPEGRYSWNLRLAEKRSQSVVQYIKGIWPEIPDSLLAVENVAEDWDPVLYYVKRSKEGWKDEALQILRAKSDDREQKLQDLWGGVVWDELLWNCFTRIRRTEIEFDPQSNTQFSETVVSGEISIKFAVGQTALVKSVLDNTAQLAALSGLLSDGVSPSDTLYLDAYASPEGRLSWNRVLARRRAESIKKYIVDYGIPESRVIVRTNDENWGGLRLVVSEEYFGSDKSDILSIIDDESMDSEQREAALKRLSGGRVWNRLVAGWMSSLRCVNVTVQAAR